MVQLVDTPSSKVGGCRFESGWGYMKMLGSRLRAERRNTCRYGCCTRTKAHRRRKTKHERMRDKVPVAQLVRAADS